MPWLQNFEAVGAAVPDAMSGTSFAVTIASQNTYACRYGPGRSVICCTLLDFAENGVEVDVQPCDFSTACRCSKAEDQNFQVCIVWHSARRAPSTSVLQLRERGTP